MKRLSEPEMLLEPIKKLSKFLLRHVARIIICSLPKKNAIVRAGAALPPGFRSQYTARFFSEISRHSDKLPSELFSNLGIEKKLRVALPSIKTDLLFGAPHLFVGERSTLDLTLFAMQNSDCFIDIGANVGLFTYYLRSRDKTGKPIYFFEADPEIFTATEENFRNNGIENAKGYQIAVGEKTGSCTFYRNRTDDSSGSIVEEDWSMHDLEAIEVNMISFGDFVESMKLTNMCVKVDVEGAEEQFYEGAKLCLDRVSYLIMEILGPAINRDFQKKVIFDGKFEAYYINDYDLHHSRVGEYDYNPPFYNWLFCRESPETLRRRLKGTRFRVLS